MTISPERVRELQSIPDSAIDLSDIPELDESFWNEAKMTHPKNKKAVSLRFDQDVLDWCRSQGEGYQSLMSSVLKFYVEHQASVSK